jgi:hypothetical protein
MGETREQAIEQLAIRLFAKEEYLEPSDRFNWDHDAETNWTALDDRTRDFYRSCVSDLATERHLWLQAFRG